MRKVILSEILSLLAPVSAYFEALGIDPDQILDQDC